MQTSTTRRTISAITVAVLLALLTLLTPASATAASPAASPQIVHPMSALGSTPVSSFEYSFSGVTIKVPTGCGLTHWISGSGLTIRDENAGTDCAGLAAITPPGFCGWRIDFRSVNNYGNTFLVDRGPTHNTCTHSTYRDQPIDWYRQPGKECADLFVVGALRATQCHFIHS